MQNEISKKYKMSLNYSPNPEKSGFFLLAFYQDFIKIFSFIHNFTLMSDKVPHHHEEPESHENKNSHEPHEHTNKNHKKGFMDKCVTNP